MEFIGLIILWIGIGFSVVGVLGVIRMPDLYCRLHASGKVSTVGLCGLLIGVALVLPSAALKLLALAIFAVLTLPVGTHAIAAAAYRHGVPMKAAVRDEMATREVRKVPDTETPRSSNTRRTPMVQTYDLSPTTGGD